MIMAVKCTQTNVQTGANTAPVENPLAPPDPTHGETARVSTEASRPQSRPSVDCLQFSASSHASLQAHGWQQKASTDAVIIRRNYYVLDENAAITQIPGVIFLLALNELNKNPYLVNPTASVQSSPGTHFLFFLFAYIHLIFDQTPPLPFRPPPASFLHLTASSA